jgi:hypothetical protein
MLFGLTDATLTIVDNSPGFTDDLVIGNTNLISGDNPQFIAQADLSNEIHSHVDFFLSNNAGVGAYGILLNLHSDNADIADSKNFWFVFNYGMSEADFHFKALPAFGKIPEPSSFLVLMGLAAGAIRYRNRKACERWRR